jgi:PAS domain-containing protein
MNRSKDTEHSPNAINLYELIRAILGETVSDNEIARRWKIDARVFNDLKHGRIAVPRLSRLKELAEVLNINEHFVYAAAAGVKLPKLMTLIRRQDVSAAVGLLVGATTQAQDELAASNKRLAEVTTELELRSAQMHALVEQLFVAVLTLDMTGNVLHVNQIGRDLFGVDDGTPGVPLSVAMKGTLFLDLDGQPFDATQLPSYRALKSKTPERRVFSVHRPNAKGRLVAATATPMKAGKKFIGVVSVLRDIDDILNAVGGIGLSVPKKR